MCRDTFESTAAAAKRSRVAQILTQLEHEGYIYTTFDDNHVKATDPDDPRLDSPDDVAYQRELDAVLDQGDGFYSVIDGELRAGIGAAPTSDSWPQQVGPTSKKKHAQRTPGLPHSECYPDKFARLEERHGYTDDDRRKLMQKFCMWCTERGCVDCALKHGDNPYTCPSYEDVVGSQPPQYD